MTRKTFTRRGFLGLTVAAVAGFGLTACTGAAPEAVVATRRPRPPPLLRLFTYEGEETIGPLKAQIAKFDEQNGTTTTVDNLPGSGAAVYPDKLKTELLGGKDRTCGGSGAARSAAPFAKAKQAASTSRRTTPSTAGTARSTDRHRGDDLRRRQVRGAVLLPGVGGWYNKPLFAKAGSSEEPTSRTPSWSRSTTSWSPPASPVGGTGGSTAGTSCGCTSTCWSTPRAGAARQAADRRGDLGPPRGGRGLHPLQEVAGQEVDPRRRAGPRPGRHRARYVQGKTACTITGQWTENNHILGAKKSPAEFGNFQLPTDQTPSRHSGFVEGYMINAKSAGKDKAAALLDFIVSPRPRRR